MTLLPNAKLLNQALNNSNPDFKASKPVFRSENEKENQQFNSNIREIGIQTELCDCCLRNTAFKNPEMAAKPESLSTLVPSEAPEREEKESIGEKVVSLDEKTEKNKEEVSGTVS